MMWNNAFIYGDLVTDAKGDLHRVRKGEIEEITAENSVLGKEICLSSLLLPDEILDSVIEFTLENKPRLYVRACENLMDVGVIEARFHLSPVMLLHKLGLLTENCTVVGANYLDNDDVDLMAQCGTKVVLCPTYALGKGYGFPCVVPMLGKIEVAIGTMDNSFNKSGSVLDEARALYLGTNCVMRKENALTVADLRKIIGFTGSDGELKSLLNL